MLAQVLASVCLSVTRRYCVKTAKLIQLVFGREDFLGLSRAVLKVNSGISRNNTQRLRQWTVVEL